MSFLAIEKSHYNFTNEIPQFFGMTKSIFMKLPQQTSNCHFEMSSFEIEKSHYNFTQ
ncbi:hypothetical protein [Polaribacter atrinae]|uniref:hypothetical protein n=1 Tax=Polaribacter atrinae TaxID=1333662 RepID=UPI000AE4BFE9